MNARATAQERKYMYHDNNDIRDWLQLFEFENDGQGHCPDWKLYKSPAATKKLCERVQAMDGLLSVSHFIIAFQELKASGELVQLRQPEAIDPPEFILTAAEYNRLSTRELRLRYKAEPEFRSCVDTLIANGEI
jgi:hypothetical protein